VELRELKTFCSVARLGSISKAAEHLDIGQPAATMHIKKLEQELGVLLFDRVRRPIQLTVAGEKLYELARPLVEAVDSLARETSLAEEHGPVSVAATHDIIAHLLPRTVAAYRAAHPAVHLRLRSGVRADVLQMVKDGDADIGIIPGPSVSDEFTFQGLFPYERVLLVPKGHPILKERLESLAQIARYPLIQLGKRTYTRNVLEEALQRRGLAYEIVVELDSVDSIKRYVAMGMGISVSSKMGMEPEDMQRLETMDLSHLLPTEQAGIVTYRARSFSVAARNFIPVLQRTVSTAMQNRR
jgi:DNA-binding transcriptional LysR family regulator